MTLRGIAPSKACGYCGGLGEVEGAESCLQSPYYVKCPRCGGTGLKETGAKA